MMYHVNQLGKFKVLSGKNPLSGRHASGTKRTLNKVIRKNLIGSFLVKGIGIAVNLAMIPIGINLLDKERFGVWIIINSLLAWLTFFDLGIGNGMRNKLTQAFLKKRINESKQLVSTGYVSVMLTTSIVFLLFLFLNKYVNWSLVFNVSDSLNAELAKVIFWSVTLFLLQIVLKNIGFILLSLQLTAINNALSVISNSLSLVIIFCWQLTKLPGSLLMFALCICGMPVLVYLLTSLIFFTGRFHFLRPDFIHVNYSSLKKIGGLGIRFFVIQVTAMLLFQGNNIFITQYFGPKEVTSYNISYRYFNVMIMVFSILLTPFWSAFTKAYTEANISWIKSTLKKLQKLWFVSVLVIVLMVLAANFVYRIWIGNDVEVSTDMNIANGLFAIIYAWNSIYLYFLNGTGKIRLQFYLTLIVLGLYVPLTMFFLHFYRLPSIIIYTNCLIQLLFSIFCYVQVEKILKGKTYGIWNH